MCHKKNLKFQDYKNCLEAAQFENKISHFEKNKIEVDSLKKYHKKFIQNKLILKTQQRFRSQEHNVLLEKLIRLL